MGNSYAYQVATIGPLQQELRLRSLENTILNGLKIKRFFSFDAYRPTKSWNLATVVAQSVECPSKVPVWCNFTDVGSNNAAA